MRGADVCVYSFARLPKGPIAGDGPQVPEVVAEVLSKHDRWRDMHEKVDESLHVGVGLVVVLDPEAGTALLLSAEVPLEPSPTTTC